MYVAFYALGIMSCSRHNGGCSGATAWRCVALVWIAGLITGLLPAVCLAQATDPFAVCSDHRRNPPTECGCLSNRAPNRHLVGGTGPDRCYFQNPPEGFDPAHADKAELESWGISPHDAAALGNSVVRREYFHGMRREYDGDLCGHGECSPSVGMTWRPDDGTSCPFTGALAIYCVSLGIRPIPASPSPR